MQGFEEEVAFVLRRHFPPTLLIDLQASSQGALVELAQAFPYQPAAASLGLTRFTQVCASPRTELLIFYHAPHVRPQEGFWHMELCTSLRSMGQCQW